MSSSTNKRTCYTRNGTAITDLSYQPCLSDSSRDSVCCGTNHQGAGQLNVANDVCDPNGLCQNFEAFDGTNAGVKNWWRQGCTDPTWQSESCLKNVCNFDKWQVDNAPVQKCGDSGWCCGEKSCCSISSSVFRLAATLAPTAASSSSIPARTSASQSQSLLPTSSTGASFTPTTSASQSASPTAAPSTSGLSTGAKAGIGSGVAVVAILLVVIAFLIMKLRKRKQGVEKNTSDMPPLVEQEKGYYGAHEYQTGPAEMFAVDRPVEMVGSRYVAELPGSHAVK